MLLRKSLTLWLLLLTVVLTAHSALSDERQILTIKPQEASANLLQRVDPVYPPIAERAGISGVAILEIEITETGNVENVRVVSAHPLLAQAALEALQQWRYRPILRDGVARRARTQVEIRFDLPGAEEIAKTSENYFQLMDRGRQAYRGKDYPVAERNILEALTLSERLPPERYMERASALQLLAYVYINQGRNTEAQRLLEERLELLEKNQKPEEAELARAVKDLALFHQLDGNVDKAEMLYGRAIRIYEIRLTDTTPFLEEARADYAWQLAESLNSLGVICLKSGRPDEAETLFSRAVEVAEKRIKGADMLKISLENYTLALRALGKEDEASSVEHRLKELGQQGHQ